MITYQCECQECGDTHSVIIKQPPFPEVKEIFMYKCPKCNKETGHMRIDRD